MDDHCRTVQCDLVLNRNSVASLQKASGCISSPRCSLSLSNTQLTWTHPSSSSLNSLVLLSVCPFIHKQSATTWASISHFERPNFPSFLPPSSRQQTSYQDIPPANSTKYRPNTEHQISTSSKCLTKKISSTTLTRNFKQMMPHRLQLQLRPTVQRRKAISPSPAVMRISQRAVMLVSTQLDFEISY